MRYKIPFRILWITMALLAVLPISAQAWSNHVYLTYPAMGGNREYLAEVSAEPLDSFLLKEKDKIGELLKAEETWALSNIPAYPATPASLDFLTSQETNLRIRFLKALRLNPNMELPLFVMLLPGSPAPQKEPLPWSALSILPKDSKKLTFIPIRPGEKISALQVLSSASDEPDYGFDIGLWADNDTLFGREYGYGKQPFGNPKLVYGSQAPFHMGFYQESGLVFAAAPSLKKTFPEQRTHLFHALAKLAFQTGHPYWGYRFAGWGLHYLQDMTMPYHTTIMPGRSTATMLFIALVDLVGIHGPKTAAVSEVSRAHILIEKLLNQEFGGAFQEQNEGLVMLKALRDTSSDATYPDFFDHFLSQVAAKESHAAALALSSALKAIVQNQELYLDIENISAGEDFDYRKIIVGASETDIRTYSRIIEKQMRSAGAFSRIYMRSLK